MSGADAEVQKPKVQAALDATLQSAVCVGQGVATIDVILENLAAGHDWLSGTAHRRRAWVEVIAHSNGQVIYASGGATIAGETDPDRWEIRDCLLDASGKETLLPWMAASVESYTLPGRVTADRLDPRCYQRHNLRSFSTNSVLTSVPDRVTMRVRVQPIALEILDALIASGDLDASVRSAMPVLETAGVKWTPGNAQVAYQESGVTYSCVSNSNLDFASAMVPAPAPMKCAP